MIQEIKRHFTEGKTFLQFGFLKALGQGLGMVAPLVVAKYFEPYLFGSYSLAMMVIFFFTALLISSSQTPFIVLANQEKKQSGKINNTFSIQLVFLIASLAIYIILNLIFSRQLMKFSHISRLNMVFMSLAFIGLTIKAFICNVLLALNQRMKHAIAELVFGLLTLLLVLIISFTIGINLTNLFLIYFASGFTVLLTFGGTINFHQVLPFCVDKKYLIGMFNFTKWLMLGSATAYFINWGDNLVLKFFVPLKAIGHYNFAYQIFKGIVTLICVIYTYFLPFVSEYIANKDKMCNYINNKRPKIIAIGLFVIGLLFILTPYAIKFVYGNVYNDSIAVLRILLVGSVFILYTVFYDVLLKALRRYKTAHIIDISQLLLNFVLNLILVPFMGMFGAAIGTILSLFCRIVMMEIYFRVKLKKCNL